MKKAVLFIAGLGIVLSLTQTACKKDDDDPITPVTMTLYDSLGGTTMVQDPSNTSQMIEKGRLGIRSVVDSTIFVIAADPKLNGFFPVLLAEVGANNLSGFSELSKNLTDFFCVATGAKNFSYSGLSMKDAHNPAKNSRMNGMAANADFDQFVADLVAGAKKVGLSDQLIGQVGAVVETTRGDVVQK
jgi:hypothetical protein